MYFQLHYDRGIRTGLDKTEKRATSQFRPLDFKSDDHTHATKNKKRKKKRYRKLKDDSWPLGRLCLSVCIISGIRVCQYLDVVFILALGIYKCA